MAESLWRRVLFPSRRSPRPDAPGVLVITTSVWDQTLYRSVRTHGEWDMVIAHSVAEALRLLAAREFAIVIYDRDLPGADWREGLAKIVESSPRVCFLLTSRVSDEYLWREVVMHGGYDILVKPLEEDAVVHTLRRAWYYWKAEPPPRPAA
jgi:DNA-binding NtrC family response regulator